MSQHVGAGERHARLEVRDGLVGEVADRAAEELRQPGDRDGLVAAQLALDLDQRVAVGVLPRQDAVRLGADERVAAHALAALDGLEQVRVRPARHLEEGGHGRLEVRADLAVDRHDVAAAGEPPDLGERRGVLTDHGAPRLGSWARETRSARRHQPPRSMRSARPVCALKIAHLRWLLVVAAQSSRLSHSPHQTKGPPPVGRWSSRCHPHLSLPRGKDSCGTRPGPAYGRAMSWAWITAPAPSTPTGALVGAGSGRDSRVHSAAARRAPGFHLAPAL